MASIQVGTTKVKKVVEVETQEDVYILKLSVEELRTLKLILMNVGGCPKTTARKYQQQINSVIDSLKLTNFGVWDLNTSDYLADNSHGVIFNNNSLKMVESK